MKNQTNKIYKMDDLIQQKLCDDYWNAEMACKVLQTRKDRQKRLLQLTVFPVILLGTTSIFFFSHLEKNQQGGYASEESSIRVEKSVTYYQDEQDYFNRKFNYNVHLMNTVFNTNP